MEGMAGSFEIYMQTIPDPDGTRDWCSLLLHCAGVKVQQVYRSMEPVLEENIARGPMAGGFMSNGSGFAN